MLSRTGASVRTSEGVYITGELARDQRGFVVRLELPPLLRLLPLLPLALLPPYDGYGEDGYCEYERVPL